MTSRILVSQATRFKLQAWVESLTIVKSQSLRGEQYCVPIAVKHHWPSMLVINPMRCSCRVMQSLIYAFSSFHWRKSRSHWRSSSKKKNKNWRNSGLRPQMRPNLRPVRNSPGLLMCLNISKRGQVSASMMWNMQHSSKRWNFFSGKIINHPQLFKRKNPDLPHLLSNNRSSRYHRPIH